MDHATGGARPLAHDQRQSFEPVPASRTRLAARVEPICHNDLPAAHHRLVFQLPTELEEAHIGDGAGQMAVPHHAAHVQVLNANGVESAREVRRELVQGVRTDRGNAGMQPRQLRLGLLAIG